MKQNISNKNTKKKKKKKNAFGFFFFFFFTLHSFQKHRMISNNFASSPSLSSKDNPNSQQSPMVSISRDTRTNPTLLTHFPQKLGSQIKKYPPQLTFYWSNIPKSTNKGKERSFERYPAQLSLLVLLFNQYPPQLKSYWRWWHVFSNLKEFRATWKTI